MKEINEFATYLKNVRNLSDATISAYSSDLREFCAVMGFSDVVNEITLHDVETVYIANLVASGNCAASRSRKLSSVRAFYKWAVNNGIVNNNPVSGSVVAPSQPVTNESVIGQSEIPTIIETATPRVEETVKQDMPNVMHENTTSASIPTITSSTTVPEEAPKVNERLIYGGASPVVPNIEVAHVEHRPIYGGANPLDNTQSIPVAHQASSTPMNNSINSTEPSIPTIEPASISSVQNVSAPKVEPSTQVQEPPKVDIPQVTPVAPATNNSTVETKQEPKIESLF